MLRVMCGEGDVCSSEGATGPLIRMMSTLVKIMCALIRVFVY